MTIHDNYLYGYDHSLYNYKKQDLLQNFNDFNASIGIRNKVVNDWGINYSPFIQFAFFDNYLKLKENSFKFDIPVEKSLSDIYSIKLSVKADVNSYTSKNSIDIIQFNNSLF